jgi:hypothetical protein
MAPGKHLKHQGYKVKDEDKVMKQIANGKTRPPIGRHSSSAAINGTAAIAFGWQKSTENMAMREPRHDIK